MKENQYRVIKIFKALAQSTRYNIIKKLSEVDEISIIKLSENIGNNIFNVSRHLRKLKDLDLVSCYSKGKFVYSKLKNKELIKLINKFEDLFDRK